MLVGSAVRRIVHLNHLNSLPGIGRDVRAGLPGHPAPAWSELLLTLYPAAVEHQGGPFHEQVLRRLRMYLPFDCCWWATDHLVDGHHHVTGSYLWNMPADLPELFNHTEQDNVVARRTTATPYKAVCFGPTELKSNRATASLSRHADLAQVLSVATPEPQTGVLSFLSFARRNPRQPFTREDAEFLQVLMPHLGAMLHMHRSQQIMRHRARGAASTSSIAVADAGGVLHAMEPGFKTAVRREWPGWRGPLLPPAVREPLFARESRFSGHSLRLEFTWQATQVLIELTNRTPCDDLTSRELSAALCYADGNSHKEVAQRLGIAPATVRHHLRSVYSKLAIDDKAALAKLMAAR